MCDSWVTLVNKIDADACRWKSISIMLLQSTPVMSRQLGAKIREHELIGSPVISCFRAKAQYSRLAGSQSHTVTSAPLKPKQCVER